MIGELRVTKEVLQLPSNWKQVRAMQGFLEVQYSYKKCVGLLKVLFTLEKVKFSCICVKYFRLHREAFSHVFIKLKKTEIPGQISKKKFLFFFILWKTLIVCKFVNKRGKKVDSLKRFSIEFYIRIRLIENFDSWFLWKTLRFNFNDSWW